MGKNLTIKQQAENERAFQRKAKMLALVLGIAGVMSVLVVQVAFKGKPADADAKASQALQPIEGLPGAPAPSLRTTDLGNGRSGMIVLPPIGLTKRASAGMLASSTVLAKLASEDGCFKREMSGQLEKTRRAATVEDVERLQGLCASRRLEADPYQSQREALGLPVDKAAMGVGRKPEGAEGAVSNPWLPEPSKQ